MDMPVVILHSTTLLELGLFLVPPGSPAGPRTHCSQRHALSRPPGAATACRSCSKHQTDTAVLLVHLKQGAVSSASLSLGLALHLMYSCHMQPCFASPCCTPYAAPYTISGSRL
jgi:hypothetical protein